MLGIACYPPDLRSAMRAPRRARMLGGLTSVVAVLPVLAGGGCAQPNHPLDPWFLDRDEAIALATHAMEDPSPDERRRSILRLANTPHVNDPHIMRALGILTQADPSVPVRVSAATALSRAESVEACNLFTTLLPDAQAPPRDVPPEPVRATLLENLCACAARGQLVGQPSARAGDIAIRLLNDDPSRNVRLLTARLLGYFPTRESANALVDALVQRDFGVCHEAELSLKRLTGRSFDHDPRAWKQYLDGSDEPFARRNESAEDAGWNLFGWLAPDK